MNHMTEYLNLESLKATLPLPTCTSNPPHALLENSSNYSIVMNLLGIDQKDIAIQVNEAKREIAVLAKKEAQNAKRGFFWIFGVPSEGLLDSITTRYKAGVLEIVIPKYRFKSAA